MNTPLALQGTSTSVQRIPLTPPLRKGGKGDPRITSWLRLLVGLALIALFMYVMGPFKEFFPGMGSMSRFIEEKNIKATALFYTDIDEFGEATASLRDYRDYSPNRN